MTLARALATGLQYILPHKTLSHIAYKVARIRYRPIKNWMINRFVQAFNVNLNEAISDNPDDYEHFNAFFTRALKPSVRPISSDPHDVVSPVDGRISQLGPIREGRIIQAKGFDFSVAELLASDTHTAAQYAGGQFITIYLSPRDYHRIHMPVDGKPRYSTHVPGRLFSVADWTAQSIPRLFARNERLVCYFDTPLGQMPLVMVGAMLVSSMETVFHGQVTPPYARQVTQIEPRPSQPLSRGQEMGRFNYGSTVILLFPPGSITFLPELAPGTPVKMGEKIGHWSTPEATGE